MTRSSLKTTTSICIALMLSNPTASFAQTAVPVPQADSAPCAPGQKDCTPILPKPRKGPKAAANAPGAKLPDALPNTPAKPVPLPKVPDAKPAPGAKPAPAPKTPDVQPKPEVTPAPIQKAPDAMPAPAAKPAPTAKAPEVLPKPKAVPAPVPKTPDATTAPAPAGKPPVLQPKSEVAPVPVPATPAVKPTPGAPAPVIQQPPAPAAKAFPDAKGGATTAPLKPTPQIGIQAPGADNLGTTPNPKAAKPVAAANTVMTGSSTPAITLGAQDVRRSDQNTTTHNVARADQSGSGLTDLQKFGLIALGAVAVGAILSNGQTVVTNTGDRVVVRDPNGRYDVMHDDDALVRRPGSTVRTQSYNDGSVLSRIVLADGTVIVTVRDANGRVLRRSVQHPNARPVVLYDDTRPERIYVPDNRPLPAPPVIVYTTTTTRAMVLQRFQAPPAQDYGRTFSLRQVRDIAQLRHLAPAADLNGLTFDTGSSAIRPDQAQTLAALGGAMVDLISTNPSEVFLIEGHTDAIGDEASNLALSDARAESVALALTEMFGVPPQNMVTQGYGESDLAVQTQTATGRNRRVLVRRITELLDPVAAN